MLPYWEVQKIQRRIAKAERRIKAGKDVDVERARINRLISVLFQEPLMVVGPVETVELP